MFETAICITWFRTFIKDLNMHNKIWSIHHKIIEYTPQDIEYTVYIEIIEYASQYKKYTLSWY